MVTAQEFFLPTRVYFGRNSLACLRIPSGSALLVTSASVNERTVEHLHSILKSACTSLQLLARPSGEPMSSTIDSIHDTMQPFDFVVAIGGGSTLDFAKALALLRSSGGRITDYEFNSRMIKGVAPLYLVPTTCGTGSEVTPYAVINNSRSGRKFTLKHDGLRGQEVAVDPELLRQLTKEVMLASALDAFTHCLEALLTKSPTDLVRPYAIEGLRIAWRILPKIKKQDLSEADLLALSRMSLFGGIAISHSRTGLIHTMSVAFAQYCDLPHGILNARLLRFALRHSLAAYRGLLKNLIEAISGRQYSADAEAYHILIAWLENIIGEEPPLKKELIIKNSDSLVHRMLQDQGLPSVCHGLVTEEALRQLIQEIANAC